MYTLYFNYKKLKHFIILDEKAILLPEEHVPILEHVSLKQCERFLNQLKK